MPNGATEQMDGMPTACVFKLDTLRSEFSCVPYRRFRSSRETTARRLTTVQIALQTFKNLFFSYIDRDIKAIHPPPL